MIDTNQKSTNKFFLLKDYVIHETTQQAGSAHNSSLEIHGTDAHPFFSGIISSVH